MNGARNQLLLGAALSMLLVTAGCHTDPLGHVNGSLKGVAIGSALGAPPRPLSGEIVLTDDTGKATKVTTGADGTYSARLPAGSYKASVSSVTFSLPASSCRTQLDSYTVLPVGTTTIDFVCRP